MTGPRWRRNLEAIQKAQEAPAPEPVPEEAPEPEAAGDPNERYVRYDPTPGDDEAASDPVREAVEGPGESPDVEQSSGDVVEEEVQE